MKCRLNHGTVCEQNQKRKKLGQGPTIRRVESPRVLEAPYNLENSLPANKDPYQIFAGLWGYADKIQEAETKPEENHDPYHETGGSD